MAVVPPNCYSHVLDASWDSKIGNYMRLLLDSDPIQRKSHTGLCTYWGCMSTWYFAILAYGGMQNDHAIINP